MKTEKEKFYRSAYIMHLDRDNKEMLLYLLSTGRLSNELEWELCFGYLGAQNMAEAVELLASNKNYLISYNENDINKWISDKRTKKAVAPKKAKSILAKIYEYAKLK